MERSTDGEIITFYSYKGGTGRSMLLANVAWILASNGRRVLAVDWDLEAPGLHRYFAPFLVDKDMTSSDGVIDFVIDFVVAAMSPQDAAEDEGRDWFIPYANLARYAASLEWEFPDGGTLDLVGAGRQGSSYATRVNSFNWQDFYERFGGGAFLDQAKQTVKGQYDYVLIDSRTGVSDTSGICTLQMPDNLVICFTLNNQSIDGAAAVTQSIYEQRGHSDGIEIFPVAMRAELSEKAKLELRRKLARERFERILPPPDGVPWSRYWGDTEVIYIPFYAFEEILATFRDEPGDPNSILGAAERITYYLTHGEIERAIRISEPRRVEVLSHYEGTLSPTMTLDEVPATGSIFISYRRDDTSGYAGRLYDELSTHFGSDRVFVDVDIIQAGIDFQDVIRRAVDTATVVLALIGPNWNRQWDDPSDFVRLELASALGSGAYVIPVLVQGATIPRIDELPPDLQGLFRRQVIELNDARWQFDMNRLMAALDRLLSAAGAPRPAAKETPKRALVPGRDAQAERLIKGPAPIWRIVLWGAVGAAVTLGALVVYMLIRN